MAFKPNYRRDRAERQRTARARTEKNKEERRRRLRCAKPSARESKPHRMRSKRPGSLEVHACTELMPASGLTLRPWSHR
jgi:hypothetical protein